METTTLGTTSELFQTTKYYGNIGSTFLSYFCVFKSNNIFKDEP